jgi:hypothetical protein
MTPSILTWYRKISRKKDPIFMGPNELGTYKSRIFIEERVSTKR